MPIRDPERRRLEDRVRLLTAALDDIGARLKALAAERKGPPVDDPRMLVHDRLTWTRRRLSTLLETHERKLRALPD